MPALRVFTENNGRRDQIQIIDGRDARDVEWRQLPPADLVYSQRFLHYLPFPDASDLLHALVRPRRRCSFYLSMSGLDSELADGYPEGPIETRFARLGAGLRAKHGHRPAGVPVHHR